MLLEDSEAAFGAQLLDLFDGDSDFVEHVTLEDHGFADFPDEVSGELVAILEHDDVGRGSGRLRLCRHGQVEDASTEQARHHEDPETSRTSMRRFLIGAHLLKIAGRHISRHRKRWPTLGRATHKTLQLIGLNSSIMSPERYLHKTVAV